MTFLGFVGNWVLELAAIVDVVNNRLVNVVFCKLVVIDQDPSCGPRTLLSWAAHVSTRGATPGTHPTVPDTAATNNDRSLSVRQNITDGPGRHVHTTTRMVDSTGCSTDDAELGDTLSSGVS